MKEVFSNITKSEKRILIFIIVIGVIILGGYFFYVSNQSSKTPIDDNNPTKEQIESKEKLLNQLKQQFIDLKRNSNDGFSNRRILPLNYTAQYNYNGKKAIVKRVNNLLYVEVDNNRMYVENIDRNIKYVRILKVDNNFNITQADSFGNLYSSPEIFMVSNVLEHFLQTVDGSSTTFSNYYNVLGNYIEPGLKNSPDGGELITVNKQYINGQLSAINIIFPVINPDEEFSTQLPPIKITFNKIGTTVINIK